MKKDTFKEPATETDSSYATPPMNELFSAILSLENTDEAARFFRDLLTVSELKEFANRWQMVKLLLEKRPYTEIAAQLATSTATVTRVALWLFNGAGGYKLVASRVLKTKPSEAKHSTKPFKLRGKYTFLQKP